MPKLLRFQSRPFRLPTVLLLLHLATLSRSGSESKPSTAPGAPDIFPAAASWVPQGDTSRPQSVREAGQAFMRFPCRFSGKHPLPRAFWDVSVNLDLRLAAGVRFRFRCGDSSAARSFAIHLRTRTGWYSGFFTPQSGNGDWETIEIRKEEMLLEEAPNGWGNINALRLAVWRGSDRDVSVDLADFAALPCRSRIGVVRGISALRSGDTHRNGLQLYTANIMTALKGATLPAILLEDVELTSALAAKFDMLFLPFNPDMPAPVAETLVSFMDNGGRLVGFYDIHPALAEAAGVRRAGYVKASQIPGGISSVRFHVQSEAGFPAEVRQSSWNFIDLRPASSDCRVLGRWHNQSGADTGYPAILASSRAVWMGHVLLNGGSPEARQLVLAMAGLFQAGIWQRASAAAILRIGRGVFPGSQANAYEQLEAMSVSEPLAAALLQRALAAHSQAAALHNHGRYVEAVSQARLANEGFRQAYLRVQSSRKPEFRGVWCHRAEGVSGLSWDEAAKLLASCGFNALFANMSWAASAAYPSAILPSMAGLSGSRDVLADALKACHQHGIGLHLWKVVFRLQDNPEPFLLEQLRREGRLVLKTNGEQLNWLCPSHPQNRLQVRQSLAEVARRYPVDGIHLDYIRFPGSDSCACQSCHRQFQRYCGTELADWPTDLRRIPGLQKKWQEFRREQITSLVGDIRRDLRSIKPAIQLSAAVFGDPFGSRDGIAQDWVRWCQLGYLDFVCPMNYVVSAQAQAALIQKQLQALGTSCARLYPGIGVSSRQLDSIAVVQQIQASRQAGLSGFVLFEYNEREARTVLPDLAKGITQTPR